MKPTFKNSEFTNYWKDEEGNYWVREAPIVGTKYDELETLKERMRYWRYHKLTYEEFCIMRLMGTFPEYCYNDSVNYGSHWHQGKLIKEGGRDES